MNCQGLAGVGLQETGDVGSLPLWSWGWNPAGLGSVGPGSVGALDVPGPRFESGPGQGRRRGTMVFMLGGSVAAAFSGWPSLPGHVQDQPRSREQGMEKGRRRVTLQWRNLSAR